MSEPCDLSAVGAAEYLRGAQTLERFGKSMEKRFGQRIPPDVLEATFQNAANRYRTGQVPVENIKREMVDAVRKDVLSSRSLGKKIADGIQDSVSAPMSLITSVDLSAPGRQGGKLTFANPRLAIFNRESPFVKQIQALGPRGQEIADAVHADIMTRPTTPLYEEAKLHFTEHGDKVDLTKGEEVFRSNLAGKLPWVKVSERAYVTYLNKLRADTFDMLHAQMTKNGKPATEEELKALGNFINVATGRGGGERLATFSRAASGILFSPRNMVSQFQYAAGQPLYGGSARTRKIIAGQYVQYAMAVGAMYALAKAGGADIDFDPRSSDFMKMRFGNVIIDPIGGVEQPISLAAQLLTGEKEKQSGGMRDISPSETIGRFARNKLSPVAGSVFDFFSRNEPNPGFRKNDTSPRYPDGTLKAPYGKDFLGRDVSEQGGLGTDVAKIVDKARGGNGAMSENTRLLRALDYYFTKNAVPITLTDLSSAFSQNGARVEDIPKSLLPVTAGIFGMNARVMDKDEKSRRENK